MPDNTAYFEKYKDPTALKWQIFAKLEEGYIEPFSRREHKAIIKEMKAGGNFIKVAAALGRYPPEIAYYLLSIGTEIPNMFYTLQCGQITIFIGLTPEDAAEVEREVAAFENLSQSSSAEQNS